MLKAVGMSLKTKSVSSVHFRPKNCMSKTVNDHKTFLFDSFCLCLLLIMLSILQKKSLDPKDGFVGSQGIWNFFDLFLCLVAYLDLVLQAATTHPPESTGANLLRFFRLIRSLENDWPEQVEWEGPDLVKSW